MQKNRTINSAKRAIFLTQHCLAILNEENIILVAIENDVK